MFEPFCDSGKTQVALINAVQVYCYEEQRATKSFPQLLKVTNSLASILAHLILGPLQILYNKDCVTAQAIIYWHQKGAKPQGKQSFLKATEALVKASKYNYVN